MDTFAQYVMNGLQLSILVYLLAVGLTLIFGLMNTLNLAHGAFFTLGAYAGYLIAHKTGSFWWALTLGPLVPAVIGGCLQFFILQPLVERGRSSHLDLALLTFGFLFATAGTVEFFFGSAFYSIEPPGELSGMVTFAGIGFPVYRLFTIGLGFAVAGLLWLVLERTLIGSVVKAGVENREMVMSLGINIRQVFALVFALGSALAGVAGVVAAPITSIYSQMGSSILVITFVVVVIGGLGNIAGSFWSSIIVGMVDTFSQAYWPESELFAVYALLILVMIGKPNGLFGAVGRIG